MGLAKSLEKGKKIDEAMEKITEAATIAPDDLEVCKQYAHVLLSAQRYEKALELIKKIDEKCGGKDLQILDLYGQYFVCRGDEEAANTYFEKIKKINHHYKDYMINASDRYIQTGNYEKAEEMANKFVDSRPQLPEGYNLLGTINSARGELSKAKAQYEKGISLKNPNIYAVKELEKIYNEMETNKEIYNDGEKPIAVDADNLTEEQGGNLSEDESLDDNTNEQVDALMTAAENGEDELPDIGSLESTPPIEQALTGEDGEFWEDFDDDPDAEPKQQLDEEDEPYDENEEDSDLMSMMTPAAGEGEESLESGLSQDDGDFDFGDFEDADSPVVEPESPAAATEEPVAEPESPAAATEDPVVECEPGERIETTPSPQPETTPEAATPSVDMSEAQQMMNDLKQQQKELELQQRELALQQKEFADELKQENEKMIQETVEKAVEEAVEEKFSEYDLPPETEEVTEEPVVEPAEEPVVECEQSECIETTDDTAETTEEPSEEVPSDDFDLQLDDNEETAETLAEEAALDGLDTEDSEEPVVEFEQSESIETTDDVAETTDDVAETTEDTAEAEDKTEAPEDEYTTDLFVTVDEMTELLGEGPATSGAPAFRPVEEISQESAPVEEEPLSDESFVTADDMLDKIGRILNDDDMKKDCAAELELFKTLRTLSGFLPEKDKNSYDCCRMRMIIEYIIQKLSGKPGLLITAESLIKSGVLGDEYNRQLEDCCEEELSNDLIRHVISDMKKLAQNLEDRELSNALCVSADGILEQIALIDQKVAIFG